MKAFSSGQEHAFIASIVYRLSDFKNITVVFEGDTSVEKLKTAETRSALAQIIGTNSMVSLASALEMPRMSRS